MVEDPARTAVVRIDMGRPTCVALKNVTAKARTTAKLSFKVNDPAPSCGTAKATITVKKGAKVVKRIVVASVRVNATKVFAYKLGKLRRGTYTWTVSAVDAAGNVQLKTSTRKLVVA